LSPKPTLPRLMLVTDRRRTRRRALVPLVAKAVEGGVGFVQLRERDLPDDELRPLVRELRDALGGAATIVVNTAYRVARTDDLGLHLPASAPLPWSGGGGRPALFGRSAHDPEEAALAVSENADYLVLGTIYPSESKPGHPGAGLELVREIGRQVEPMPVYAIGGVRVSRIPDLIHAGAHGVAVCGAILGANDPRRVAEAMTLALTVASSG